MSGFSGVVGSLFAFLVLIVIFVGGFYLFLQNVSTQQDFLSDGLDRSSYVLREDFNFGNFFSKSGRLQMEVFNVGIEDLKFREGVDECFEFFVGDDFILSSDFDFKKSGNLGANFYFIGEGDSGLIYFKDFSKFDDGDFLKAISCFGNFKEFSFNLSRVNWFFDNLSKKVDLDVGVDNFDREDLEVDFSFNSSLLNFSMLDLEDVKVVCLVSDFEVLNLPFDNFKQRLDDESKNDLQVSLGGSYNVDFYDPVGVTGVVLDGLKFINESYVRVNSFELDSNSYTVSFWFKSDVDLDYNSEKRVLFNVSSDYLIGHNVLGLGKFGLFGYDDGGSRVFSLLSDSVSFKKNVWYNLVFVLDSDLGEHKFFLNGVQDGSTSQFWSGDFKSGLVLGGAEGFSLDEFRVLNVALNSSLVLDFVRDELNYFEFDLSNVSLNRSVGFEEFNFSVELPYVEKNFDLGCELYYGLE